MKDYDELTICPECGGWTQEGPKCRCIHCQEDDAAQHRYAKRSKTDIANDLRAHLAKDGTANDSTTDDLYRQWHKIGISRDIELEDIEKWVEATL